MSFWGVIVGLILGVWSINGHASQPTTLSSNAVLTMARERDGAVVENPNVYLPKDRFLLFATVPGYDSVEVEVVIFQEDKTYMLYTHPLRIEPGSRVPLPGAFSLDGGMDTDICLLIGNPVVERETIADMTQEERRTAACCQRLTAGEDADEI